MKDRNVANRGEGISITTNEKYKPNTLRGCIDSSPLLGACCTNACQHRGTCQAPRIPLLIYSVILNRREGTALIDAYLNDLAGGPA